MDAGLLAQLVVNGLLLGGVYAMASMGLTLIFGVVRVKNFAHGELIMVGMYLTYWLNVWFGLSPYVAALVVTPLCFAFGLFYGRVVIEPLLGGAVRSQMFATFGLSILLQNLALMLFGANFRTLPQYSPKGIWFVFDAIVLSKENTILFLVGVGVVITLAWFLKSTFLGRAISSVAQDPTAAQLMGVNVKWIYRLTIGIGTGLAGLTGALLMPMYYAYPTIGASFIIVAFTVVVLGGMGNIWGALIAGLIVGVVEAFSEFFISPELKTAVYYTLFVAVLLFRPSGLLGVVGSEEVGLK